MMFEEAADSPRSQDPADGTTENPADGAVDGPAQEIDAALDTSTEADADAAEPALSERDAAILAFEKQWWKYAGAKEQAIRELFDLSATQYYQVLNTLLDSPAALTAEPMLVKRLRRMRASRQRDRTQRRSQA